MRLYFTISDLHGRPISMEQFEYLGFDRTNPNHFIVCLGDFFDRWKQNKEVLDFFMDLKQRLGDRVVLIYGNHDIFLTNFINTMEANFKMGELIVFDRTDYYRWMDNGGEVTAKQLFGSIDGIYTSSKLNRIKRLRKFIDYLVPYYETKDYIFTHASIDEDYNVDTWNREFFHTGMKTDKTVVIGHTPHLYLMGRSTFTLKDIELEDDYLEGYSVVAVSDENTQCKVVNIDNGLGNNIVVFEESIEEGD